MLCLFSGVFDISFQYTSQNGTGTGEIALDVKTVDDLPVGKMTYM